MLKGYDIICFGTADWDNPYRTNQHHIMERLSCNNRVLFVESLGLRRPVMQKKDLSRIFSRLLKGIRGVKIKNKNLLIFSPLVLPFHKYSIIRALNNIILIISLKMIFVKHNFKSDIVWTYAPIKNHIDSKLVVYHCVDELSANPLIPEVLEKIEEKFIRKSADLVFVTSKSLYDSKKKFSDRVYYFPNVADFEHFNKATHKGCEVPEDIKDIEKPIAGFIGAISEYKLDFDLISYVAENMHEVSFVFIGPVGEGEKAVSIDDLNRLSNIYFLGPKPYEKLPRYLSEFDVCLLPNKINKYTKNMFPMKFFEYLSSGRPVIATELPSLNDFKDYFYQASDKKEFLNKLKIALNEKNLNKVNDRIKLASCYDWENRINEMSEIIENAW